SGFWRPPIVRAAATATPSREGFRTSWRWRRKGRRTQPNRSSCLRLPIWLVPIQKVPHVQRHGVPGGAPRGGVLPKRLPAVPLQLRDHGFRLKLQRLVATALELLVEKLGEDLVCVLRHPFHFPHLLTPR